MKPTKWVNVNIVQGRYPGDNGWEDVCCDLDRKVAREDLKAHRMNQPEYPHRLIRRRVLRTRYETGDF